MFEVSSVLSITYQPWVITAYKYDITEQRPSRLHNTKATRQSHNNRLADHTDGAYR